MDYLKGIRQKIDDFCINKMNGWRTTFDCRNIDL